MVTAKSEICFNSDQFACGAKNLQDQREVVIYSPKKFVNINNLVVNFGKNLE